MTGSRPPEHFARIYETSRDPWGFTTSGYEQAKYARTLSILGERRFASALEVGCSIGILTRMLAARCDAVLGVDIVDKPLEAARAGCADLPGVRFRRMQVPAEWPEERFDLIVFSEVLYFLAPPDIERCVSRVATSALPGAAVVLVNWLGQSDDPCTGDEAAAHFIAAADGILRIERTERNPGYRLDLLAA